MFGFMFSSLPRSHQVMIMFARRQCEYYAGTIFYYLQAQVTSYLDTAFHQLNINFADWWFRNCFDL